MLRKIINYKSNSVNDSLRSLYMPCFKHYLNYDRYDETAYPYLLAASDEYISSDYRIMVCGQETNGWGGEADCDSVDLLMNIYHSFISEDNYSSPYWNLIRNIRKSVCESISKRTGWIYNNVVKIGKIEDVGCDEDINNWAIKNFNVLKKEIEILKPDMILFLSGPNYDSRIEPLLGKFKKEAVPGGQDIILENLIFNDKNMPVAYRCYHPGYIQRNGLYFRAIELLSNLITENV